MALITRVLQSGTRVALDMTTLTIMRHLPREVDPLVYNMSHEDPGDVTYNQIGGLADQIRELREVSFSLLWEGVFLLFLSPRVAYSNYKLHCRCLVYILLLECWEQQELY